MTSLVPGLDQGRDPDRDQDLAPDRKTSRARDQDRDPTERLNKGREGISTETQTETGFHGTVMAKNSR